MRSDIETWKPLKDFEDTYQISNYGNIKRINAFHRKHEGHIMKPTPGQNGYLKLNITDNTGKRRAIYMHRTVALQFVPNPESKPIVCHRDGNKLNNRADNLYWGDWSANTYDAVRHGTNFNAAKEECKRGHAFTEENTNTWFDAKGRKHRQCRVCLRLAHERAQAKKLYRP